MYTNTEKKRLLFLAISLCVAAAVFLKNAWVTEDTYIMFRSLEQLFAGNGPIWNPHDRVQVYTSPLWYWILSLARIVSADLYLDVIVLSLVFWLGAVFLLRRFFGNDAILLLAVLFLASSNAFFDYTSSGLENPLAYLLIAAYLFAYNALFTRPDGTGSSTERKGEIRRVLCLFGSIILVRHDLLLLFLPSVLYMIGDKRKSLSGREWLAALFISMTPFIIWSLFSTLYYGFPFPNTAYAKLNTGIEKSALFSQGAYYFISSLRYDTVTLCVIGFALIVTLAPSSARHIKFLSIGILLNLVYIVYAGGDFMEGRFFSYAYIISISLLLINLREKLRERVKYLPWTVVSLYLIFYPHTPFNSSMNYSIERIYHGVANERGYYFNDLSLYRYLEARREGRLFPDQEWSREGIDFKKSGTNVSIKGNIGIYGYFAGLNQIIIDPYALADPLLARLPAKKIWRIGHFGRTIPKGYVDSILSGSNKIEDKAIKELYGKIRIVTQQDELFTWERLKTILLFNIGAYRQLTVHL